MSFSYLAVKSTHQLCALTTFALFFYRGLWLLKYTDAKRPRWMFILPHAVDTVLLISAISLVIITHQYPGSQTWLNAKIAALLAYIILGMIAFRFAKTRPIKLTAWVLGQLVFLYIVFVAFTRSPVLHW